MKDPGLFVSNEKAAKVLAAFNEVDPFHCYYGDDVNPDEYFGYAERTYTALAEGHDTEYSVIAGFHPGQIHDGWVNSEHIDAIVELIDR